MPLSNAERQRRYRQRQKEKRAELAKLPSWVKPLVDRIAQERRQALSTEVAEDLAHKLYLAVDRFYSRHAVRIAAEKRIRTKQGARRANKKAPQS